jgi:hypothetical protein
MTPQPTSPQDDHKDERRRLLILAALLFLAIGCLVCGTARLATSQIEVDTGQSEILSQLNADYSIWELVRFAPVNPAIIAEALRDRGWLVPTQVVAEGPSEPGSATPSPTREPPATATTTPTRSLPPTPAPSPTATLQPTATTIPTDTSIPPPPPPTPTDTPIAGIIAGVLRNDLAYAGGAGTAAGVCDAAMQGVTVELYVGSPPSGLPAQTTTTDASCAYEFSPPALGTYTVRVDGGTFNINNDPAYPSGTLPEQTFANGVSALGGQDPDDPDDHWVTVSFTGADIPDVDFGFSYEAVVNENTSGQGSLEQAIINANLIAGANTIVFASPLGPYTITPGFSTITGDETTIDGTMTTVTLDGGGPGATFDGLSIQAANVTIQGLTIQNYSGSGVVVGNGTAGVADYAAIQNCTISLNDTSGIWVDTADGVVITGCTLEDNVDPANGSRGQIEIRGASHNGMIENCVVANDLTINSRGGDGIRFDSTAPSGWLVQNNEIYGHQNSSSNEGIIVRGSDHQILFNTIYDNYTGISVSDDASDRNLISQNSIYSNTSDGILLSGCPSVGGPNECLAAPLLSSPPGRIVQAGFTPPSPYLSPETVEFFRADAAGEGMTFCFAVTDSDLDGVVQVDLDVVLCAGDLVPGPIAAGDSLTATLIDSANNTSEFATNLAAP